MSLSSTVVLLTSRQSHRRPADPAELPPEGLPELAGWQRRRRLPPAREVGGDFYDFIELPDGELGIVIGDVTDKGVPAALVMATTRSVLRAAAQRLIAPGEVLERVNELLCPDMPENMFVTCLYAVLEPGQRPAAFANAGHDLPYLGRPSGDMSCVPRNAARPDAGHGVRGGRGQLGPAAAGCSTATAWPRRTTRPARCSASRAASARPTARRRGADRPLLAELDGFTGGDGGSRRTTSRWSRSRSPGAPAPVGACSPSSRSPAARATSARRRPVRRGARRLGPAPSRLERAEDRRRPRPP